MAPGQINARRKTGPQFMGLPLAVCSLVALCTGLALAEPVRLGETALSSKRCPVVVMATTDESGRPLPKQYHQPSVWRCTGFAGRYVLIAYGDQRQGLAFGPKDGPPTDYLWPDHFGSWGPSVEWRGERKAANTGPVFAIATYTWDTGPPDAESPRERGAEIAVIRVGSELEDTCILAWIDATIGPRARDIARMYADREGPGRVCNLSDEPVRIGPERRN
jgi:hypothetical protein